MVQRVIPKLNTLFDNIIVQAEFRHQRYVIESSRSSRGWILLAVLMLLPGLITSVLLMGFALTKNDPTDLFASPISPTMSAVEAVANLGVVSMMTMNLALYPVVLLITTGLAANSISREKTQRTWEVLLLTNVDARQLIWGKWWASLKALYGDHFMVLILRLGVIGLIVSQNSDSLPAGLPGIPDHITHTVILSALLIAFTVLDAMFTAGLGIAAAISELSGVLTGTLVLMIRVSGIIFNFFYLIIIFLLLLTTPDWSYLVMGLVGIVIGVIMIWLTMLVAQRTAMHGSVSAPEF